MNWIKKWISVSVCFGLLLQSGTAAWAGTPSRLEELRQLQQQARAALAQHPQRADYIRNLLTLSAGAAMMAALAEQTQARAVQAFVSARDEARFPRPKTTFSPRSSADNRMLLARKKAPELTGNLFDPPPAPAPAPAPTPAPQKDLSWLYEPEQPLVPKNKQPTLFEMPKGEVKPNTYLSKRIWEIYKYRMDLLTPGEKEAVIEALDEAVAYKKAAGRQAALDFLDKKASLCSRTSIYFDLARRMLVIGAVLAVADFCFSSISEDMVKRMAHNPVLFLDASEEDLARLARNPQSTEYGRHIAQAVQMLADMPLSAAEQRWIAQPPSIPPAISSHQLAR